MPYFKSFTGDETVQIYYEDLGKGDPIVFIHGWPLSHEMWEYQVTPLRELGYRCITYDRRGFGKSEQSLKSYDYDVLAEDLKNLLDEINVDNVTLVGFSMGGGEVIRYCSKYNNKRVSKVILVSSIIPYMLQTDDNPEGVPADAFDEFENQIREDRPGFFSNFCKHFYGVGFLSHPVSDGILNWTHSMLFPASQKAVLNCMSSFSQTDFRNELSAINVPVLIVHGDNDRTVPIKATSEQAAKMIKGAVYKIYPDAPHGLFFTHKDILNRDIISFIITGDVNMEDVIEGDASILPSNEPLPGLDE